jgi:hypothetical protein
VTQYLFSIGDLWCNTNSNNYLVIQREFCAF